MPISPASSPYSEMQLPCLADPEQREAFVARIGPLLDGARDERHHLVYLDEAHIHQDVDLGYGWGERGQRFQVASSSPGLRAC